VGLGLLLTLPLAVIALLMAPKFVPAHVNGEHGRGRAPFSRTPPRTTVTSARLPSRP
jgi:hypothetical protein